MQAHRFEALPEVWEQVNMELEDSISTLLDPDKKAAYDANLRSQEPVVKARQQFAGTRPQGQTGLIACPHCDTPAPATRRFCGNCGCPLWEPCFQCGTLAMVSERFCGACGANLTTGVQDQALVFEKAIREAERLRTEYRYDEAIDLLSPIVKVEHSRLQQHVRRATEAITAITAARDDVRERVEKVSQEAKQRVADGDYEGAVGLLEEVPSPVRDDSVGQLLSEAKGRLEEIANLDKEIREAVRANRVSDVLQLVDRMLALKPDHPTATKLVTKFREHFVNLARTSLAKYQYEAAVKSLDQVPQTARDEVWIKANQQAAELAQLSWALRNAPVVDATLVAFAERLLQAAPGDPKATAALVEVKRRLQLGPKDTSCLTIPWAAPPEQTYLGYPIDWLTGFQRIGGTESLDRTPLLEHPSCFFVAAGLALQGLGKAAMKVNLLPGDRSVKGTVAQLWRKLPTRAAWGIDLGTSSLKAVRLSVDSQQNQVVMEACDFIEHRKPLSQAINDEEEKTLIQETISTFLGRNDIKACRNCLGLPSRMVLIRQLKLPPLEEAKMANVLQYEMRRQMPCPLDDLVWGHVVSEYAKAEIPKELDVTLVAAKRLQLKDRLAKIEALGLPLDLVQGDALALHNCLTYEHETRTGSPAPTKRDDANAVTAVIDMGNDTMNVMALAPRLAWFHNCGLGGYSFTRALVKELQVSSAQAEQIKRTPTAAVDLAPVFTAMEAVFETVAEEVQSALAAFAKAHRHRHVARILGVGGGFQIHGLLRYLRFGR